MSGAISKSREAWKLPGKTKQKRPLVPPLLWVPPVLKELPNADFTSQAPSLDRNIFTSCLPRPLAWAGEQLPDCLINYGHHNTSCLSEWTVPAACPCNAPWKASSQGTVAIVPQKTLRTKGWAGGWR